MFETITAEAPDLEELQGPAPEPSVARVDVFRYLTRNPGSRAGEIARGLGAPQSVIYAYLHGGRGEYFACRDGRWYPIPAADLAGPAPFVA